MIVKNGPVRVRTGGTWKTSSATKVRVGGQWRPRPGQTSGTSAPFGTAPFGTSRFGG